MCVEDELRTMTVLEYRAFNFHTRCRRTVDRQEPVVLGTVTS
jgi:hypothetical protein